MPDFRIFIKLCLLLSLCIQAQLVGNWRW